MTTRVTVTYAMDRETRARVDLRDISPRFTDGITETYEAATESYALACALTLASGTSATFIAVGGRKFTRVYDEGARRYTTLWDVAS